MNAINLTFQILNSQFPDKSIKFKTRVESIVINTKIQFILCKVCKSLIFFYKTNHLTFDQNFLNKFCQMKRASG